MWACRTKPIFQFRTAYSALRTVYIPHASLVSFVSVKLFWCPWLLQFCPVLSGWIRGLDSGQFWSYASPIPSRFDVVICGIHYASDGYLRPSVCTIPGVRSVNLGRSPMNLSGGIVQYGTGATALACDVHTILKNFQMSIFCCG